jgi:hypothetical protein
LFYFYNNKNFLFNKESFESKEEVMNLIRKLELDKELINLEKNRNFDFRNNFKYLANGVFQAEGHIGGYFSSKKNIFFRPIVFIGLTANLETLKFFVTLNDELKLGMRYSVEKISSGKYFVKLFSRD